METSAATEAAAEAGAAGRGAPAESTGAPRAQRPEELRPDELRPACAEVEAAASHPVSEPGCTILGLMRGRESRAGSRCVLGAALVSYGGWTEPG